MGSIVESQEDRVRVILVLSEGICNAAVILLVLPAFDNTDLDFFSASDGLSLGSTLGDCLLFP